jgi:eukaryotic-like serine/threonine-protein kinase
VVGQQVGRFHIEATLGRGAMGTVHRATDPTLKREVALKILDPEAESGASSLDPETRARFAREARAAAKIEHINVVAVYEVGEHEGLPFIAMELVVGTTLRHLIGDKAISIPMRIRWLVEIARALDVAHEAGLVHRDVKPENVLVSKEGVAKLTDFGIVKQRARESHPAGGPLSFRTQTGQLVGTPDYMAPEQWASADVDARADQYAFGLIAYELLTEKPLPLGRPPPIQNANPGLPNQVATAITKAIEHRPDDRYPSMKSLIEELSPFAAAEVSDQALTRSMPPPALSDSKEKLAIGIAPTISVKPTDFALQHTVPLAPTPVKPAEEPTHRRAKAITQEPIARRPPPPQEGPSTKKMFFSAVAITIVGVIALIGLTIAIYEVTR